MGGGEGKEAGRGDLYPQASGPKLNISWSFVGKLFPLLSIMEILAPSQVLGQDCRQDTD